MSKRELQDAWKRAHRDQWFNEGFKAAKNKAVDIVSAVAENEDWRPEDARMAGIGPSKIVRALRRAANHIRCMPKPRRPDDQTVESEE